VTFETTGRYARCAGTPAPAVRHGRGEPGRFAKVFGYVRHFNRATVEVPIGRVSPLRARLAEAATNRQELTERIQWSLARSRRRFGCMRRGIAQKCPKSCGRPRATAAGCALAALRRGLSAASSWYQSKREFATLRGEQLPQGWIDPAEPFDAAIGTGCGPWFRCRSMRRIRNAAVGGAALTRRRLYPQREQSHHAPGRSDHCLNATSILPLLRRDRRGLARGTRESAEIGRHGRDPAGIRTTLRRFWPA